MKIPTTEECENIWDENKVPQNVREHMIAVNKVAMFLGKKLKEAGENINLELLDKASLLHDLDKIPSLKKGGHGHMTRDILTKKGHSKVGELAYKHKFGQVNNLRTWEEKIINYADKRCKDDEIVSLKERFDDIAKRYKELVTGDSLKMEKLFYDLEKEIFSKLDIKPEELKQNIK